MLPHIAELSIASLTGEEDESASFGPSAFSRPRDLRRWFFEDEKRGEMKQKHGVVIMLKRALGVPISFE